MGFIPPPPPTPRVCDIGNIKRKLLTVMGGIGRPERAVWGRGGGVYEGGVFIALWPQCSVLHPRFRCMKQLQWNLDLTKSLGTGQICSLNGGFVISKTSI